MVKLRQFVISEAD